MKQVLHIVLLLIGLPSFGNAQTPFQEGMITYQGDTVNRYEKQPASLAISRLVVYKKQDLVRIEVWRRSPFSKAAPEKHIQIRNRNGIYSFIESPGVSALLEKLPDSLKNEFPDAALFMAYDDEKRQQARQALNGFWATYRVEKVVQKTKWLGLPAEEVRLSGGTTNEPLEAVITQAIDLPVKLAFGVLTDVPGTPLQFVVQEYGWAVRLTATEIKAETLPDSLFQVDAGRKLMSVKEMLNQTREWMK